MNLVHTGQTQTATIASVPGVESTAVAREFRTAVGGFLCCCGAVQSTSLHTGVPEK